MGAHHDDTSGTIWFILSWSVEFWFPVVLGRVLQSATSLVTAELLLLIFCNDSWKAEFSQVHHLYLFFFFFFMAVLGLQAAAHGLSLLVASRGRSLRSPASHRGGFSSCRLQAVGCTGFSKRFS